MVTPQKNTKTVDIICIARQTSSRFPNKIFAKINGRPMIELIVGKLNKTKANIIFAIPNNTNNDELADYLKKNSINFVRGSENNVLERFSNAASYAKADYVQRFNCDNLLFDIEYMVKMHKIVNDHPSNDIFTNTQCSNHSGQSIEIIKRNLCYPIKEPSLYEQEHVFPYFYRIYKKKFELPCPAKKMFPVDEPNQLEEVVKNNLLDD